MPKAAGSADWQIGSREDIEEHKRAAGTTESPFASSQLFSVQGRVAVITGGGSGIGSMVAAGFVANGARVYICSRKDCTALAEELTSRGPGECYALQADVSSRESLEQLAATIDERESETGVDILINNAGTNWAQPIESYSDRGWDKVYAVNVRGVFMTSQVILPLLERAAARSKRRSVIVNVGSIEGHWTPGHDTWAYSSGKAAVNHLSTVMAGKFGMDGRPINVNAILPGPFTSRMMREMIANVGAETIGSTNAVGRIGSPLDMAGLTLFLCSRAGEFINGAKLIIDGGAVIMPQNAVNPNPQPAPKL